MVTLTTGDCRNTPTSKSRMDLTSAFELPPSSMLPLLHHFLACGLLPRQIKRRPAKETLDHAPHPIRRATPLGPSRNTPDLPSPLKKRRPPCRWSRGYRVRLRGERVAGTVEERRPPLWSVNVTEHAIFHHRAKTKAEWLSDVLSGFEPGDMGELISSRAWLIGQSMISLNEASFLSPVPVPPSVQLPANTPGSKTTRSLCGTAEVRFPS